MTWMFVVFLLGGGIGAAAGAAWADSMRQLREAEHQRMTKELWEEIKRLRAHIADMIGREA